MSSHEMQEASPEKGMFILKIKRFAWPDLVNE